MTHHSREERSNGGSGFGASPPIFFQSVDTLIPTLKDADSLPDLTAVVESLARLSSTERSQLTADTELGVAIHGDGSHAFDTLIYLEEVPGILEPFADTTVVDLGAGRASFGYMLAVNSGAKAYVAVEPWFTDQLLVSIEGKVKELGEKAIPYAIAAEPIQLFLRRVPNDAVSVLACALDDVAMPSIYESERIAREITRIVAPNGAYVSYNSRFSPDLVRDHYYEDTSVPGMNVTVSRFRKRS